MCIRDRGYDVYFQTGTDEHCQKIELKAEEAGVTPKEFVDNVSGEIKRIWDLMNTSYDKFIRTTDKDHEEQVKKIFKKMYAKGDIYKGHYEGMYCTPVSYTHLDVYKRQDDIWHLDKVIVKKN